MFMFITFKCKLNELNVKEYWPNSMKGLLWKFILILLKTKCTHSQKYKRDFYRDYRERRQDGTQGQNNEEENQPVPIFIKGKLVL